jgi:hypothetical protein
VYDACFTIANDMSSPIGTAALANFNDGNPWVPVQ